MHIDGSVLARAADQLKTALRHVEAAHGIEAPRLVGRSRAREAVQTALGQAHDWAKSASRTLRQAGSATADARMAVDDLAADIDAIRFRRDVLSARNGDAWRAITDVTRRTGLTRSLDDLRWIGERESILADPRSATRAWDSLGEVLPDANREIELADLVQIRRILDLPDGVRPDIRREVGSYTLDEIIDAGWLPRSDGRSFVQELRRRLSIERLREEGARMASDPAITAASIRQHLHDMAAKPDAEITLDDLRQLALMDELPMQLRPALPDKASFYTRHQLFEHEWLPVHDSDAKQELASLRRWSDRTRLLEDPQVTKQTLTAELDAMLAKPDIDITIDDLRRLAVYDELPQHVRPALPSKASRYARGQLHAHSRLPFQDSEASAEFHNLRLFRAAALRTRDSNTAEALAIIDRSHDQFTRSDAERLALLEALPADRRPDIPPAVRALTRDRVADDIARIALKPQEQITHADLDRIALIDPLPASLRPELPAPASNYDRHVIASNGWLPSSSQSSRAEFASLRRWATLETEIGRTAARQRAAAGEQLDPLTLASLARGGEETLRSVGMSIDDLLRHSVDALRGSSPKDLDAIDASLRLSKHVLAGISDTTAQMRQISVGTTELIDRNISRIAGKLRDGLPNFPDHAEVGRVAEQVELVLALRAATPQRDRVASAAARAADPLPW